MRRAFFLMAAFALGCGRGGLFGESGQTPTPSPAVSGEPTKHLITIANGNVPAGQDLTDFPVYVHLQDPALIGAALPYFWQDTQALHFELTHHDIDAGAIHAWVLLPTLSNDKDTVFELRYNDPAGVPAIVDPTQVWVNAYAGVWHLDGHERDSTASGLDGVAMVPPASGQLDGAGSFGNGEYINVPDPGTAFPLDAGTADFTLSAWIWFDSTLTNSDSLTIASTGGGPTPNAGYWFILEPTTNRMSVWLSDGTVRERNNSGSPIGWVEQTWHHVVVSLTRGPTEDRAEFYFDTNYSNETESVVAGRSLNSNFGFNIGRKPEGIPMPYFGNLDEVRVSTVARDNDWLDTEFANQADAAAFVTLGPAEPLVP